MLWTLPLKVRRVPKTSETRASTGARNFPDHSRSGSVWLKHILLDGLVLMNLLQLLMAGFGKPLGNGHSDAGILRRPDRNLSGK